MALLRAAFVAVLARRFAISRFASCLLGTSYFKWLVRPVRVVLHSVVSIVCFKESYAESVGAGAPFYLAAVIKYLAAEVLELASNADHDNIPRHLQLARNPKRRRVEQAKYDFNFLL